MLYRLAEPYTCYIFLIISHRLLIRPINQLLRLLEIFRCLNRYFQLSCTVMPNPARISCESFFQFHSIWGKLHSEQNLFVVNFNTENILHFLISQVQFQLIWNKIISQRFDIVAKCCI